MNKQGPSLLRIATMVMFSLSCFALLTFLWVSFGGSIPLKPSPYQLKANFPEATTLAEQADVRIAGVTVGKVRRKQLEPGSSRTQAVLEIQPKFAPLPRDTRAILRQKTLLGETYVELTPSTRASGSLQDQATLSNVQVEPTVALDQILRIFDPQTKQAFRDWVASSAKQIQGSAPKDLNDALGNLAGFAQDGAGTLQILDNQSSAVRSLVKNTGIVFAALNERRGQLRGLIQSSNTTFAALSSQQLSLIELFRVFPTFLDESKATLARLETFSTNTRPLVDALKPVADNLGPTVTDLGALAPNLKTLFIRLPPVIRASKTDLPQGARLLNGAPQLLAGLHTFLPELNPILSYLNFDQNRVAHFFTDGAAGFHYHLAGPNDGVPRLALAQFANTNNRSLGFQQTVPPYDRGSTYLAPNAYGRAIPLGAIESFTCRHNMNGGEQRNPDPQNMLPPCFVQPASLYDGHQFPHVDRGVVRRAPSPSNTLQPNQFATPDRPLSSGR